MRGNYIFVFFIRIILYIMYLNIKIYIHNSLDFFWILFFMIIKVQAAVCYADPKQAYEYLLAQENYETQAREQAVVNINSASEGELVTLDGIGSSKAQAIILYREMFGPFTSVDELEKVKGIGAKTIANNRARMRVQH